MPAYNFTERTRMALMVAGIEAAEFGHEYIGTEHILLALIRDTDDPAVIALTHLGANLAEIRATIAATVKKGGSATPAGAQRPYTSRVKHVLELAMIAAREDNHSPVGTPHLLLGLLREKVGIAAQVLQRAGVTAAGLEAAIDRATGDV